MRAIVLASTALVLFPLSALAQSVRIGSDSAVNEGAVAPIVLTRTGDLTKPSMTTLFTGQSADTAVPLNDYTPFAVIQLWNPGESSKTVTVSTMDRDAPIGTSKRLTIKLVVNRGASLLDGTQYITIKGLGPPPPPPPPPPQPVLCPDGSTVIPPATCPVAPPPPPPPPPPPSGHIDNKVAAEGDSITNTCPHGFYCDLLRVASPGVTVVGLGVSGSDIGAVTRRAAAIDTHNPEVVTLLIGANDMYNGQLAVTWQMWLDKVWLYTDALRAKGYKVAMGTILPQCCFGTSAYHAEFNRRRPLVNAAIRAAVGTHIDAVIDFAADPVIGVDFSAKNALYPDGLHPSSGYRTDTNTAHYRMSLVYKPVVDALLAQGGGTTTPPPPPPPPVVCPDGTTLPAGSTCPALPPPPPPPVVSLTGLPPITSNFDFNTALITTGQIPGSGRPDVVGAFRFICGAGQLSYDDPILFPGQPGKSHLHQYYGNVTANAHSTYASLRGAGDSTCNWTGTGQAANRSAYWMPAMLDGKGNVVRPDYVSIYYKQRPQSDPTVSNPLDPKYFGKAIQLPNGIKFIFGWDPTGLNSIKTGGLWFSCQGPTAGTGKYQTLATALANCSAGNQVGAIIEAPECWDGKNLDSLDHRSHVAYASYGTWGYLKCPSTHPYNIPTFTLGAWYTVAAGDNTALWSLSSDMMAPGQPAGHTFHADFFMAWDPSVHDMWWQNCIAKLLNCSGGQLGNGRDLKGAAAHNRKTILPSRLVPVP